MCPKFCGFLGVSQVSPVGASPGQGPRGQVTSQSTGSGEGAISGFSQPGSPGTWPLSLHLHLSQPDLCVSPSPTFLSEPSQQLLPTSLLCRQPRLPPAGPDSVPGVESSLPLSSDTRDTGHRKPYVLWSSNLGTLFHFRSIAPSRAGLTSGAGS